MIKAKIFKDEYSDIQIEVLDNSWITIYGSKGNSMTLGKPENERIELLENAIKYARNLKGKEK